MVKIYYPESMTWETQAIINSVIHEYEEPDQEMEYNPFEWYDPWSMHIIHSPSEESQQQQDVTPSSEEEYFDVPSPDSFSPEPWNWWSEQLFC